MRIEFGMLQAIGEGMDLLAHYREELNISEILYTWNHGSVVRSWLIELMKKLHDEKGGFKVPSYVEDTRRSELAGKRCHADGSKLSPL